jgi:hypothetical protein
MSNQTWGHLRDHLRHAISTAKTVKRGGSHASWQYGSMVPVGSRIPQGGKPGDAYASYASMSADSIDDVDVMFNHAEVLCFGCVFLIKY